jgi:Flp pilus assembly protein TadG
MPVIQQNCRRCTARVSRGVVMVYSAVAIVVLCGILSFAVDYGRVQLVKTELQRLADAAAVYSAAQVTVQANLRSFARAAATENLVDNRSLSLTNADIERGTWNATTRTFTPTAISPTAVRVTARRMASRSTGVPLIFGQIIGRNTVDVSASSVAVWVPPVTTTTVVDAKRSIYYYQLPDGTYVPDSWGGDTVDASYRPVEIAVSPGDRITFTPDGEATFSVGHDGYTGPNGNGSYIAYQVQPAWQNGFSDLRAPVVSLAGAFVGTGSPPMPATMDFSTAESRYVLDVSPQLKQVFFIGDGDQTETCDEARDYIAPPGATKLLLGVYDWWVYRDNAGSFNVSITTKGRAKLVR